MQPMQHQMMGYDRAITMFSPDGRLLQVEYAKKTVRQGSTAIGMGCSDGVVLVADKREVDTLTIVKDICDLKQICTQSGGLRPFGVSILVAGIDDHTPRLFETDPIGIYFQYRATAIGEGEVEVEEILHNE